MHKNISILNEGLPAWLAAFVAEEIWSAARIYGVLQEYCNQGGGRIICLIILTRGHEKAGSIS